MAIKVAGTTVVDDSRNLVNVIGIKTVNGNSILGSGDITVQAVDANLAKLNVTQTYTALQTFTGVSSDTVVEKTVGAGVTVAGVVLKNSQISDAYGNVRDIPFISAQKTTAYTLQTSDIGQLVVVATGGSVVIPNSVFSAGNAISIANNTAAAITITCTVGTAYISGVATDRSTVSLKPAGLATVVFLSSAYCIISGAVI